MSAFVVDKAHIDYLVQAALTYGDHYLRWGITYVNDLTADCVGADLWHENRASVAYRYQESDHDALREPPIELYTFDWFAVSPLTLNPVQVLKAIACYQYQACEHPEWTESEAKSFCERLAWSAIDKLPGYDKAAWEIVR